MDELQDVLEQACRSSLTQMGTTGKAMRHNPIAWWTRNLTNQRKELNAKRRYQRTKVDSEIRGQRKEQYLTAKAEYTAAIMREKSKPWKQFCNLTSANNHWIAIYKMAARKTKKTHK
jgi:chromatin remodeling complex protein RSC6